MIYFSYTGRNNESNDSTQNLKTTLWYPSKVGGIYRGCKWLQCSTVTLNLEPVFPRVTIYQPTRRDGCIAGWPVHDCPGQDSNLGP